MRNSLTLGKVVLYVVLTVASLLAIFPFYWMFVMATNPSHLINQTPPVVIPGTELITNFQNVMANVDFFGAFKNSFIVAVTVTVGTLFLCSLAGFAFAKLDFPWKKFWFGAILVTMMIPPQLGLIPQYFIITKLGWLSDLRAVIVPGLINAFGIFWMRQYIKDSIPDALMEAGKIDGCSTFRMYWNIVIPSITPAFATLGIIVFMNVWNDFLWPLVVLQDTASHTLQVALRSLNDSYVNDYGMIMSGTLWATVPLIAIFLLFNRFFINSLTQGAVKG